ncbi:hypothetical protein U1Q18_038863 [Sarracenia purpurea var. burkii]
MGHPPPPNPVATTSGVAVATEPKTETLGESSSSAPATTPMDPPLPQNPNPHVSNAVQPQSNGHPESQPNPPQDESPPVEIAAENSTQSVDTKQKQCLNVAIPYSIPEWSGPPRHHHFLEILKEGSIIDQLDVYEKGAYMFGRVDLCDFILEHPTISRFHAVLQFKRNGGAYIYDLGSTHGTFVNKNQVKPKIYAQLHVGDVIRFGHSSRLYIFQGPSELMPPLVVWPVLKESDLKSIRNAKMREDMQDMEASLLRAKLEASLADGISWGMGEDALEEIEDDVEEISWQNYKGQLTEKQEKTRDKVIKRLEKIANMKKEIDAIRVKDISQGGLTQGQQTQIARNEQRISQIMEELENLEETLNESIRESLGARVGRMPLAKRKGIMEDEEECLSDEDEFYDRTKKKTSNEKSGANQSIETADTLLDKKDAIIKEIEEKKKLLLEEKDRIALENVASGDTLDAYMSGLSSQLVLDKTEQLQKELSTLQSDLDRILYLLKIADPAGEAARKRESKSKDPIPSPFKVPSFASVNKIQSKSEKKIESEKSASGSINKQGATDVTMELGKKREVDEVVVDAEESKTTAYTVVKHQWLGAVQNMETKETPPEGPLDLQAPDQFVDYKDRKKILENQDAEKANEDSGIENAAPGLIIRKRKQVEKASVNVTNDSEQSTSSSVGGAEIRAEDAVALLLKHKRGYYVSDEEAQNIEDVSRGNQSGKDNNFPKRVLGPERPSFLGTETDYESWVPPKGQSGDGRTSLNDRYGY